MVLEALEDACPTDSEGGAQLGNLNPLLGS